MRGKPAPLDAGWAVGLGQQVRGRREVCRGEEEGLLGATLLVQSKANCSRNKFLGLTSVLPPRGHWAVAVPTSPPSSIRAWLSRSVDLSRAPQDIPTVLGDEHLC